jgi:signal transduction histidine kinase
MADSDRSRAPETSGIGADMQIRPRMLSAAQTELERQNQDLRDTNGKLQVSNDRHLDLYHLSPVGHATLNLAAEIVEANLTLAELMQTECEQLIGKPLIGFIAPQDQDAWRFYWRGLREGHNPSNIVIRLDVGKGPLCHVRIDARVLQRQDHVPEYLLSFSEMPQNTMPTIYQHAMGIIETIRQPVLVLRDDLTVEVMNRAFGETFRLSSDEVIGQRIYDLGQGQWNIPALRALIEGVLAHEEVLEGYEIRHVFPRIGHRILVLNVRRLRQARDPHARILLTMEDITDSVLKERALEELNARLTETNEELRMFAYSVSHDLRAPLRSIDGFTLALLEDFSDALDPEAQSHLMRVRVAVGRMALLIDGLLQLSRIIHVKPQYRTTDLSAMARSVAVSLEESEPTRGVVWDIQDGLLAIVDRALMRTVLENLLGNAWKFSAHCDVTHIAFGAETTEEGETVYFVRDEGAGFSMAYADKLFGTFQRLHRQDEFEGTGVGLATAQRIVRLHGGRIWAEAVEDEGATFYFTLAKDKEDE